MLNVSETKRFVASCSIRPYGHCRKVPTARRLVTSWMTLRDSMTSYSWCQFSQSSHS